MQMYLFHDPTDPADPFIAGNSGDEADVVYHEYTHGLSNRLVVDADGISTLGNIQAGSMGEAWSDWYAMDYLVAKGLEKDTAAAGEVRGRQVRDGGRAPIRTEPLRLPGRRRRRRACPGTAGAGPGGYTYGDFGRIIGRPEVHADGEIWAQTLWDLRKAIGSKKAESLVTRAHGAVPGEPVVPGHAQLDPAGRPGRQRRQAAEEDLEGLRQARHGLLRRRHVDGDDTHAGRGLLDAAGGRTRRAAR